MGETVESIGILANKDKIIQAVNELRANKLRVAGINKENSAIYDRMDEIMSRDAFKLLCKTLEMNNDQQKDLFNDVQDIPKIINDVIAAVEVLDEDQDEEEAA